MQYGASSLRLLVNGSGEAEGAARIIRRTRAPARWPRDCTIRGLSLVHRRADPCAAGRPATHPTATTRHQRGPEPDHRDLRQREYNTEDELEAAVVALE
jgi:hypothetical protein